MLFSMPLCVCAGVCSIRLRSCLVVVVEVVVGGEACPLEGLVVWLCAKKAEVMVVMMLPIPEVVGLLQRMLPTRVTPQTERRNRKS